LSKAYDLGRISSGTLSRDLSSAWARFRKKQDPNAPITTGDNLNKLNGANRLWALKDINLQIKSGEILGIIGRNGAGKSTLLKILSRITSPTKGEVKIMGKLASLLEIGIGFHPELTGRENIYLNGAIMGMTKEEIKNRLEQIIDFSGIETYIDTPVKRYSSGMGVRLGFSVAAHLDSDILLVDEVLAVGDAEFRKKCIEKMNNISAVGRTIIFVSHNMAAIKQLCNNCIHIQHGSIIDIGKPDMVINNYLKNTETMSDLISSKSFNLKPHKDIQLISAVCLDERSIETKIFNYENEITIELTYLLRNKIPGVFAFIDFHDIDGNLVLTSCSNDNAIDPIATLSNEKTIIQIRFPQKLLREGRYSVSTWIGTNQGISHWIIDEHLNMIVFEVVDNSTLIGDQRKGLLGPILKWNRI
jgi:lipopolysaccharide transport system ATP-binding protein